MSSGQLPPGLTLNPTTGVVSGIPTRDGTYNFTITATDSNQPTPHTGTQPFSLMVSASLMLNPPTLPAGELSTAYNTLITASGGVGPYTFAVTFASLPHHHGYRYSRCYRRSRLFHCGQWHFNIESVNITFGKTQHGL